MLRRVSGPSGAIRWGYRAISTLGAWRYEAGESQQGTLTAQVVDVDEFGLTQQPLVVSVSVGRSVWTWPVLDLRRDGSSVSITVGPVESA